MRVGLITDINRSLESFAEKIHESFGYMTTHEKQQLAERAMHVGIISYDEYAEYISTKPE